MNTTKNQLASSKQSKNEGVFFWILIFASVAIPILSIGDNLGIYFDAIFPDYAATQILDPQLHQARWYISWPILTQYYHGNVSMFLSALVILFTGTTSLLQHRLLFAGIIVICLYVIDRLLAQSGLVRPARHAMILAFSFMPIMLDFCLTPCYIELPGTALALTSFLLISGDDEPSNAKIWLSFTLLGFAFYSYFNFLFLFPGFLVVVLWRRKKRIGKFILACSGMLSGVGLYVYGYADALLDNSVLSLGSFLSFTIAAGVVVLIEIVLYRLVKNGKEKLCVTGFAVIGIGAMAIGFLLRNRLIQIATDTNLAGYSANLPERIMAVGKGWYYAISGITTEQRIFGYQVTTYGWIAFLILVIVNVSYALFMCLDKEFRKSSRAWKGLAVTLLYLLCTVPLITRMHTQHFVPLSFFSLVACAIELYEMCGRISERFSFHTRYLAAAAVLLMGAFSFLCLRDRYRIIDEISVTGGSKPYTCQTNKLAKEALENLRNGKKEIYLFPEWGFMAEFNYLTNNNVAFSTDASDGHMRELLDDGYNLQIVYWDDMDTDYYMEIAANVARPENISKYDYMGDDATIDFCRIEIDTSEKIDWWQQIGQDRYYIGPSGRPSTGWLYWNHNWYYMSDTGAMQTGWINTAGKWYYLSDTGVMQTGWIHLDADYYLDESGAMLTGTQVIDGVRCEFDEDGRLIRKENDNG